MHLSILSCRRVGYNRSGLSKSFFRFGKEKILEEEEEEEKNLQRVTKKRNSLKVGVEPVNSLRPQF